MEENEFELLNIKGYTITISDLKGRGDAIGIVITSFIISLIKSISSDNIKGVTV